MSGAAGTLLYGAWRAVGATVATAARIGHAGRGRTAADLAERLALDPPATGAERPIWLHAASVGELAPLAALAAALRRAGCDAPHVVTTSTTTGRTRARRELDPDARLAPLDARRPVDRWIAATRPRLHVVVETEIWPVRLAQLWRAGIPAALVSARLSPERWPRYHRARSLYDRCLGQLALLAPASAADRQRFLALGLPPGAVGPEGNLKWDAAPEPPAPADQQALRAELGLDPAVPWVVLGSAHPGEPGPLLEALLARLGGTLPCGLLVAPRHPARFDEVAAELEAVGVPLHRASRGPAPPGAQVVVLDRLGVLARVYPLAAAAVVGGTFVPVGGHSPLEAAAAGCPLLTGPHRTHQLDLVEPLEAAGAAACTATPTEAADVLARWIEQPDERAAAGRAARAEVDRRRGIADRLAATLRGLPQ
jgi:3-deoxy-D-manno-octulosonic-acid transferase